MHSFFDFSDPHMRTLLMVQVLGFPLAFAVRAFRHGMRAPKLAGDNRLRAWLLMAASLCFAFTSIGFVCYEALGISFLVVGVALNIVAFRLARKLATAAEARAEESLATSLKRTKVQRNPAVSYPPKRRRAR